MDHNYTQPKLYMPKEKGKPWYIWYRYRVPDSTKWRKFQVKKNMNRIKSLSDRKVYGKNLVVAMTQLLKEGFNPFIEVADMKNSTIKKEHTIKEAFEIGLSVKRKEIKQTTYIDYESRINSFEKYLLKNGYSRITEVNKAVVSIFLNKYNASNSNNYKATISSLFSILSEQSIIGYNFINEIRAKKVTKRAIVIYTEKQVEEITKLLDQQDKSLLLYVQLISFMFWRPIEIVRIELKNISFDTMRISVNTKGKDYKTKIIPVLLAENLKEFIGSRTVGRLFELNAISDMDKRGYMTKIFRKFRTKNKIDSSFKSYSFRHTYITKIYLILRQTKNKADSIEELSLITGHTSNAIWKYIKINDVELPKDYSHLLESKDDM